MCRWPRLCARCARGSRRLIAPADVISATPPNDKLFKTIAPAGLMVVAPCPTLTAPFEAMVVFVPPTFRPWQLTVVELSVSPRSVWPETAPEPGARGN